MAKAARAKKRLGRSLLAGDVTIAELRTLTKRFETAKHYIRDELATWANDSIVVDGDLRIAGDFDTAAHGLCRLVVTGSLRVSGLYRDHDDPETAVFVLGNLEAQRAITNGALCVGKNVVVRETLVGYYNDHCAEILGSVTAKLFAPENHFFTIKGKLSVEHVLGSHAEYRVPGKLKTKAEPVADDVIRDLVVPEILEVEDYGDPSETPEINVNHSELRARVAAGKPILAKRKPRKK